ncbi:hypothetical protein M0812_00340 [Anaeramoeba flamelloides]|uniref:Uncharacterized protein n=1 Tax=Anaeramoeba flamelloides TaxID=1746091 RepID=A0AAV8A107_9EUKA|nr:hypothetical protein M0812_00340 [Anaeramoeba flamelloides]
MSKGVFPHRRRTINQVRIETLLKNYTNSIIGMTMPMLFVPNAPKELKINKEIFKLSQILTMENVFAFMISKYNIFPQVNQPENTWVKFKSTPSTGFNSLMYYIDSLQFQKQRQSIVHELKKAFEKKKNFFVGFEIYHFDEHFEVPKTVVVNKVSLKKFLEDTNESDIESRVKKIYRGLTFFFSARYNLVNITRKCRKTMKFTTNYTYENGDQKLSLFNLFLNIPKIQVNFLNPQNRKRLPTRINNNNINNNNNNNNDYNERTRTRTGSKLIKLYNSIENNTNIHCNLSSHQNNQILQKQIPKEFFSLIFRDQQTKTELGALALSTTEKLKDYTETERKLVKCLSLLKYYQPQNY